MVNDTVARRYNSGFFGALWLLCLSFIMRLDSGLRGGGGRWLVGMWLVGNDALAKHDVDQ